MPKVLVPLAQGCEELEAITVIDLLRRAEIDVVTAGLDDEPIVCSRGTMMIADTTIDGALDDDYDMVVLPGGLPGADNLEKDSRIQGLLVNMSNNDKYIAAICAAPKVLATAGLLVDRKVTCYPGALKDYAIDGLVYEEKPVVIDGKIITSRGPGTAMDFTLELIEILTTQAKRQEVESALQRPA